MLSACKNHVAATCGQGGESMVRDLRPKACMHPPRVASRSSSVCCLFEWDSRTYNSFGFNGWVSAFERMMITIRSSDGDMLCSALSSGSGKGVVFTWAVTSRDWLRAAATPSQIYPIFATSQFLNYLSCSNASSSRRNTVIHAYISP